MVCAPSCWNSQRAKGHTQAEIRGFQEQSELKTVALEAQIQDLIGQYNRECTVTAALRHLTAPVRELPVELMIEIFQLVVQGKRQHWPRGGHIQGYPGEHFKRALCISQVCARWRQVATSARELWTVIEVDLAVQDRTYANVVGGWLCRSASLPISISLRGRSDSSPESSKITEQVLSTAPRWCSLRLLEEHPSFMLFAELESCTLGCLKELDLGWGPQEEDQSEDERSIYHCRLDAPLLHKLTFNPCYSPICQLLWEQLTDLTLSSVDSPCVGFGVDAITLPHLQCLTIIFACEPDWEGNHTCPGDQCMEFLGCLSVPSLEHLNVHFREPHGWNTPIFTAFQLRTPSITWLELSNSRLTPGQFISILTHTPALTHLTLGFYRWPLDCGEAYMLALSYRPGCSPLVPRLQHMTILEVPNSRAQEFLASMIRTRAEAGSAVARWKEITLNIPSLQLHPSLSDILDEVNATM
ncbi:hypothetical protein C8R46DRAFT_1221798 [Mycena filopes]|nr:hypothetical protein C8R46DRAFT_1221798 [Mycena filopes]